MSGYAVMRRAAVLACALGLAGCVPSGFKTTVAPRVPAADALARTSAGLPQGAWPAPDWIKQLGDPQLDRLVELAFKANPDWQIAQARIRVAQAQLEQFSSVTGLTGTLSASVEKAYPPQSNNLADVAVNGTQFPISLFGNSVQSPSSVLLGLNYDLDLWGKNAAQTRALLSLRDAARVEAEEARLTLSVALASLYCELDTTYTLRDLLEARRAASDQITAVLRERQARGIDNAYDANDAAVKRAKLEESISLNDASQKLLEIQIGVLTGQGPESGLSLTRPHLGELADAALPPRLPLDLLGRRPDIVAARLRVESAFATIDGTRAAFYPDINLSAVGGLFATPPAALFTHQALGGSIGPALSLPVFDRARLKAKLSGDVANADISIATYNQTIDAALAQVAQRLTALSTVGRLLAEQQASVDAAQHMVSIADQRHQRGLVMEKDVNTARLTLFDEQAQLANLLAARRTLRIGLIGALGGGFDARKMPDGGASLPNSVLSLPAQSRLTDTHFD